MIVQRLGPKSLPAKYFKKPKGVEIQEIPDDQVEMLYGGSFNYGNLMEQALKNAFKDAVKSSIRSAIGF